MCLHVMYVLFAYLIKLNILAKKTARKVVPKNLYCDFVNAIKNAGLNNAGVKKLAI